MVATADAAKSVLGKGINSFVSSTLGRITIVGTTIAAIVAGIKLMDEELNLSYETSIKHTEDAISKFKNTKSEIDDVNSKVENYKTTLKNIGDSYNVDLSGVESIDGMIQKINATGQVSLIDQSELSKISLANSSLERTLELKQQAYTLEQKAAADLAKETLSKETKNEAVNSERTLGMKYNEDYYNNMTNNSKYKYGDLLESVQTDIKAVDDYKKKIEKLNEEKTKAEISELDNRKKSTPSLLSWIESKNKKSDKLQKEIDDYSATIDKIQSDVTSKETELSTLLSAFSIDGNGTKALSGYEKEFNAVKNALDSISSSTLSGSEKAISKLNSYFSSSSGSSMKQYLEDIVKNGGTAEEALEAFRASGMRLKDIGVSENAFVRYFEDIKREAQEADEAVRSVDGTFDGLKKSFESENQGANYDTTMGYYKTAKEMYKNGLVGTDDFKSMAQFGVGYDIAKKLKDNADAYTYASDAYVEAWEQSQALLERWYGNEDELTNMTNVLNDFKDAGLASSLGDNEWTFKNDDGSMKFKTTAEAADKLNTSVSNVELAMSKLEEHGFEFDGIEKSGELLENYKNSLDQIKDVYDSMEDGAQKDRLKKLIEGYDSEYEKFQDDLSGLSEDQIVKIKFEYDLASIQQKIQELKSMAEASGSNQDQAALRVTQEQALGMLEGKTGVTKDSDEGYAQVYEKRTSLAKDMTGKSEEERASINQEINALLELQNAFQQFKLDGGELDWNSFLDTPTATALFNDLIEKGTLIEQQIKELFGDSITCNIDAKLNDDNLQKKLASLKTDEKITFEADVDDLDNAQVEAVKNQDGTIKYTANVAGVPKEVHKITEQDGTIRFTTEFDGSLDWINNNLQNGETITYKADVSGIQKDIEACKDENGTIHYYSVMDDGSKQELTQQTDESGKITFTADTSQVENAIEGTKAKNPTVDLNITANAASANAVITQVSQEEISDKIVTLVGQDNASDVIEVWNTLSPEPKFAELSADDQASVAVEVWNGLSAYPKFTELSAEDQATAIVNLWNALEANPKSSELSAEDKATAMVNAYNSLYLQNKESVISQTGGEYATSVAHSVAAAINNIPSSKTSTITTVYKTIKETISKGVNAVKGFFGFGSVAGTAHLTGTAFAGGSYSDSSWINPKWQTKNSQVALVGEKSQELVVDPSSNSWYTVGDNGAEFRDIPKGAIIFNHKQTENLFKHGYINSRGKGTPDIPGAVAFASGTAYASGGRLPSSKSSSSSKKKSSSSSSKSSSKSSSNSSTSSSKSNSSSNSSNDKEETKETLDWIETKLDRIKRKIDELDTTASSTYRTWSKRNEALSSELSKVTEKISLQQQAYDRYIKEAESAGEGLSSDWIDKIQNGKIDIETITDSDLKEKISDYKNWYEKALDCRDAIIDLKEQESKLIEQRFNNIKDEYDAILKQFEHTHSMLEGAIDITETSGYIVSTKYYDSLISNENEKINQLYAEREALVNSLNSALSSGKIDKYSESWYNMQDEIDSIDESIQDCNKSTIEWGNSIRQIQWDLFDKLQDRISKINDEADFLKELMSSEKMYDDKNGGQITEYGKATFGLHGVKHNTLMAQADEYRKEMEKIDEQLKSDPFNQTLIDRRSELLKLQQESITSAKQEKDAIKDLVEDGINSQLDALQKLIDKYTDLLDTNKDMYDYQKQLAEKQKEISSIEKQLAAYQGDTSEEGASKRQQLQNDLNDAKQDLAETQYERSIADQKKLLDDLYEQYEEVLNMRLDNIDVLVSDVIANVNSEAGAIRDTLEAKADSVGYTMTESMNTIWNSANQVITNYGTNFLSSITGVQNAINDLTNLIKQAVDASNKKASAGSSSSSTKKPSSSTPASQPAKPATTSSGDGVPNVGDAVTFNSGAYYYSSDGLSPTGTQMHGQTVYITRVNNASWAKKKYHISKDRNAAHPLGWVDLSQISGYEKGIKSVPRDEMAVVGEHKKPETVVLDDGSILTPLSKNSSVFNNDAHENLWSFANDPQRFIDSMIQNPPEVPNMFNEFATNQTNTVTINIPIENVSDYNDFVRQLQKDSKFEKMVQTMVLEPIAGNSTIGKYKQRF